MLSPGPYIPIILHGGSIPAGAPGLSGTVRADSAVREIGASLIVSS